MTVVLRAFPRFVGHFDITCIRSFLSSKLIVSGRLHPQYRDMPHRHMKCYRYIRDSIFQRMCTAIRSEASYTSVKENDVENSAC